MHSPAQSLVASIFDVVPVSPSGLPVQLTVALPIAAGGIPPAALPEAGRLASGRGLTAGDAHASCLGEAAELVSSCRWGDEAVVSASYAEVRARAIHPASMLLVSDAQYEDRSAWNAAHGTYDWCPERFDELAGVDWIEAFAPDGGSSVFVTAAQTYIGTFESGDAGAFAVADSNGCAAGVTFEQAAVAGFLELVERDATALWWYGRHARPAVEVGGVEGAERMLDWMEAQGLPCHVLDLTTDFGIPVRAAICADRSGQGVAIGAAAHFDADRATIGALTEVVQTALSLELRKSVPAEPGDPFRFWLDSVSFGSMPHLLPSGLKPERIAPMSATLDRCVALCRDRGLRFLTVDLTRAAVGVPVVRVIVPGLRPLRARFAPGRLFEVPPRLGWCGQVQSASDMNPVPFAI